MASEPKQWTNDPRAVALLASCAANPPLVEWHRKVYILTADEWFLYTGTRADKLRAIRDEYQLELEAIANATNGEADWNALSRHFASPTVEQAIDAAIEAHDSRELAA